MKKLVMEFADTNPAKAVLTSETDVVPHEGERVLLQDPDHKFPTVWGRVTRSYTNSHGRPVVWIHWDENEPRSSTG